MLRGAAAAMVMFVSACAGVKSSQQPKAEKPQAQPQVVSEQNDKTVANKSDVVCRMERPTGSNIPERVCRHVGTDADEASRQTQDAVREMERGGTAVKSQ